MISHPTLEAKIIKWPIKKQLLSDAGHIINTLLHEESKKLSSVKCYDSVDALLINIEDYLRSVNPILLSFLFSATSTTREMRGFEESNSKHSKTLRVYFILNQLLFARNPKQAAPIHNVLADVVEMCSGSRQLLHILNSLGCTTSPDTHDRFVTQHAEA